MFVAVKRDLDYFARASIEDHGMCGLSAFAGKSKAQLKRAMTLHDIDFAEYTFFEIKEEKYARVLG